MNKDFVSLHMFHYAMRAAGVLNQDEDFENAYEIFLAENSTAIANTIQNMFDGLTDFQVLIQPWFINSFVDLVNLCKHRSFINDENMLIAKIDVSKNEYISVFDVAAVILQPAESGPVVQQIRRFPQLTKRAYVSLRPPTSRWCDTPPEGLPDALLVGNVMYEGKLVAVYVHAPKVLGDGCLASAARHTFPDNHPGVEYPYRYMVEALKYGNARFHVVEGDHGSCTVALVAARDIKAGEEIVVPRGLRDTGPVRKEHLWAYPRQERATFAFNQEARDEVERRMDMAQGIFGHLERVITLPQFTKVVDKYNATFAIRK